MIFNKDNGASISAIPQLLIEENVLLIHPHSIFRKGMDAILVFLLIYNAVVVPYSVAFDRDVLRKFSFLLF